MNASSWNGWLVAAVMGLVASACGDDTGGGGGGGSVVEVEPNNERVQATQLPAGGGTFTIEGTCEDSTDNDYYDAHPSTTGMFTARLEWTAGAFEMMWDPEDGFTGQQTKSMTSPIDVAGQLTAITAQFNIDCYNTGNPAGLAGLAYTVTLTLP